MYIRKNFCGIIVLQNKNDRYDPPTFASVNWIHWIANWDFKTCIQCKQMHGRIWASGAEPNPKPPLHPNCRCRIEPMQAVAVGVATKDGQDGADWWLKYYAKLPDYYICESEIRNLGWDNGDSPVKYAPGKMVTMGEFQNRNGHLPDVPGRVWHEADINYYSGKRNGHRILWSNDGLMFVTYDHYRTFIEIA